MSDCIDTVSSLMPSSSSFEGSDVQRILDGAIGLYFDEKENEIENIIDAPHLTEAEGDYLDLLHGTLYNIKRNIDESDDEYRLRLSFQAKEGLTINDIRELGCMAYAYVEDYNPNDTLTSRNTSLTKKLIIKCPNEDIENLIKDNFIWEGLVCFI